MSVFIILRQRIDILGCIVPLPFSICIKDSAVRILMVQAVQKICFSIA